MSLDRQETVVGASGESGTEARLEACAEPARRSERSIRDVSVGLLAQREHSALELVRKLAARKFKASDIEAEIAELQALDLQCDSRYAESRLRSRANRGYGPIYIRNDLRQHGVADSIAIQALQAAETDWFESAVHERHKRFGEGVPSDLKQRAKQQQFLQRRGFDHEQIQCAFGD